MVEMQDTVFSREIEPPILIKIISPLNRLWVNPIFQNRIKELSKHSGMRTKESLWDIYGFFIVGFVVELSLHISVYISYAPEPSFLAPMLTNQFPIGYCLAFIVALPAWLGYIPLAWPLPFKWTLSVANRIRQACDNSEQLESESGIVSDFARFNAICYGEIYYALDRLGPSLAWLLGCYLGWLLPLFIIDGLNPGTQMIMERLGGFEIFTIIFIAMSVILIVPVFMMAPTAGLIGLILPRWSFWILTPIQLYMSHFFYPIFVLKYIVQLVNDPLTSQVYSDAGPIAKEGMVYGGYALACLVVANILGGIIFNMRSSINRDMGRWG